MLDAEWGCSFDVFVGVAYARTCAAIRKSAHGMPAFGVPWLTRRSHPVAGGGLRSQPLAAGGPDPSLDQDSGDRDAHAGGLGGLATIPVCAKHGLYGALQVCCMTW